MCGARGELMTNKKENLWMDGEWKCVDGEKIKREKEGLVDACIRDKLEWKKNGAREKVN